MKSPFSRFIVITVLSSCLLSCYTKPELPLSDHPDSESWEDLFLADLSNAIYPDSVWSFENGEFTATEDQFLWTEKDYDNFILDLEFKNADGTNSGVVVYCSDLDDWIPNSVEVQIADAQTNPDGSKAPSWLSKAPASLPTKGKIGFQGKHAGAPVYFRNIRIHELK
jgi:hypothetical protein